MCCLLRHFLLGIIRIIHNINLKVKVFFLLFGVSILSHKILHKQIPSVHLLICFQDVRQTSHLTPDRVNSIIVSIPTDL